MATFPSIKPTYGQQKRSAPNTRTVRFADGFEHRILFGLATINEAPNFCLNTFKNPSIAKQRINKTGIY